MAGFPPQVPPPTIPGLTSGPSPGGGMGSMMPPDNLNRAIAGLNNRKGSASELMRNVVSMLETAASLDASLKDRVGAALALLRGPKAPAEKPDGED